VYAVRAEASLLCSRSGWSLSISTAYVLYKCLLSDYGPKTRFLLGPSRLAQTTWAGTSLSLRRSSSAPRHVRNPQNTAWQMSRRPPLCLHPTAG
jgi:hypothetical protein